MVVVIRGTLDFYKPRAELGFLLNEIDVAALLGRLAQRRAALLELLRSEGLLGRNRLLRCARRASPGRSRGQPGDRGPPRLRRSAPRLSVRVRGCPCSRFGAGTSRHRRSIAGALVALARRGCDIAVVVRGGGSKADLAAFDTEPVARAIATMPIPGLGRDRPHRRPVGG